MEASGSLLCKSVILIIIGFTLTETEFESVPLVPVQEQTIVENGVYINNEQENREVSSVLPGHAPPPRIPLQQDDGPLASNGSGFITIEEGDIMVARGGSDQHYRQTPEQVGNSGSRRVKRKLSGNVWPRGIIPWEIGSSKTPYKSTTLDKIREAMQWWERHTCIRFVPAYTRPYVGHEIILSIRNHLKCSSYVGFQEGVQEKKQELYLLESLCFTSIGTAAHELGHTLGLIHEHARKDRDGYVNVHPNSIDPNSLHNYAKSHFSSIPSGVPYDWSSIMHYKPSTFALLSRVPAMTGSNLRKQSLMGQRDALSYYDIKAINSHYRCQQNCVNNCENEGYPRYVNGRCVCVCPEGLSGSSCQKIDSDCGGILVLRSGQTTTLHSSTYTSRSYARKCIWLITASTGYNIEINFDQLDVARSQPSIYRGSRCIHSIEVRNNLMGQRGDVYCGRGPVGPVTTELGEHTNKMLIVLNMTDVLASNSDSFRASIKAYIDPCVSKPCHHGSTCVSRRTNSFVCSCPPGYSGRLCDQVTIGGASCDFAEGFCGFSQDYNDDLDFNREFQSFKFSEQIKTESFGNKFFIGAPIEFSLPRFGATASLRSPTFQPVKSVRCLMFSYYMAGKWQSGKLTVSLVSPGSSRPIRNVATITNHRQTGISLSNGWKREMQEITSHSSYQLIFTFTSGRSTLFNSMMGVDDISILPQKCFTSPCSSKPCKGGSVCSETGTTSYQCLCPPGVAGSVCDEYDTDGFTCNFDANDMCGWTQDRSDNFDWIRTHGASDSLERTGPVKSAQGEGYYMVADTSASTSIPGSIARLISPVLKYTGDLCVSFYYHMHGLRVGSLSLKLKTYRGVEPMRYFAKRGEQSTQWLYAHIDMKIRDYRSQFVIEATAGEPHLSDIAVDDIAVTKGRCRTNLVANTRPPVLYQSPTAQPSHNIQRLPTGQRYPDLRLQRGQSSSLRPQTTTHRPNSRTPITRHQTAQLPPVQSPPAQQSTPQQHRKLWAQASPTSPALQSSRIRVPAVRFFSSPTPNIRPFSRSSIRKLKHKGEKPSRRPSSKESMLLSCDFELESCQRYIYFPASALIWRRVRAPTASYGPDAADRGSYYIHVTSRGPGRDNDKAPSISTFPLNISGRICINFNYQIKGVDSLSVYKKSERENEMLLWQQSGERGNSWSVAAIVASLQRDSQIIITAVRDRNHQFDVSIDNLIISTGRCQQSSMQNAVSSQSSRAPTTLDPNNSIDYRCDFEQSHTCNFRNEANEGTDWIIHSGPTPSANTGPNKAQSGANYIYIEASAPTKPGSIARLVSPNLPANAGSLCLLLNICMHGEDMGQFKAYQRYDNGQTRQLIYLNIGDTDLWRKMGANIPSSDRSYVIVLEGETSARARYWLSDIALDNISLTSGAC